MLCSVVSCWGVVCNVRVSVVIDGNSYINTPTLHNFTLLAYHTLPYTPHHTTLHYTAPYLHYTELHIKDPAVLQCSVMVLSYVQWNVV